MKNIKTFESFIETQTWDNTLYHYTLKYNLDDIMENGLKPNKNSAYKDGIYGVFLTNKTSFSKVNLPQYIIDEMDLFYDEIGEDDYENSDKPVVRLTIDVSKLDINKFRPDDDYTLNKYNYNKLKNNSSNLEKCEESLDIWGSVAYIDIIKPEYIINIDYDYYS